MILLFKGVLKMSTEHLDKKECKKYYQIYSDNSNTPSLIRTIPSVLEFHQTPRFRARGLFTADREFHPALKTLLLFNCLQDYITGADKSQFL